MRLLKLLSINGGGFKSRLIILFIFLIFNLYSQDFVKIDSLDDAVATDGNNIVGADIDKDGLKELIFLGKKIQPERIAIYERNPGGGFGIPETIPFFPNWEWSVYTSIILGDFDKDGKADILQASINGNTGWEYFEVIESKNKFSYPESLVWVDSLYLPNVDEPLGYVSDIDRDNRINVTINKATLGELFSFENTGDNQYQLVFRYDSQFVLYWGVSGDLDMDSLPELIFVDYYNPTYRGVLKVYEAVGDDTLNLYTPDTLSPISANYYDNLFIGDMNGNGKPEAMIHSFAPRPNSGTWRDDVWIIEAEGDNDYRVVWYDSIPYNPAYSNYGARSSVGDVTGDGVPEVILSMTTRVFIIQYIPGQGYTYIWQKYFPANTANISTTVYDMDNDSLNEVILSVAFSGQIYKTYIYKNMAAIREGRVSFLLPEFILKSSVISDSIKIFISRPLRGLNLYLFNVMGQRVFRKSVDGRGFIVLSLKELNISEGTYFIKVEHNNNSRVFKIIYMRKK